MLKMNIIRWWNTIAHGAVVVQCQGALKVWSMTPKKTSAIRSKTFDAEADAGGIKPGMLSLIFNLNIEHLSELSFHQGSFDWWYVLNTVIGILDSVNRGLNCWKMMLEVPSVCLQLHFARNFLPLPRGLQTWNWFQSYLFYVSFFQATTCIFLQFTMLYFWQDQCLQNWVEPIYGDQCWLLLIRVTPCLVSRSDLFYCF